MIKLMIKCRFFPLNMKYASFILSWKVVEEFKNVQKYKNELKI